MMTRNKFQSFRRVIALLLMTVLLTACDFDNHSDENANRTLQAVALDGYLANAQIWLDINNNNQFDADEPHGRTDDSGVVLLDVSGVVHPEKYRLMGQAIATETTDKSRGPGDCKFFCVTGG